MGFHVSVKRMNKITMLITRLIVIFETAPLVECKLLYRECNYFNFNARYPYKPFAFWFLKSALFPPDGIDYSSVIVRKWNRQLCFERWNWLLFREKKKVKSTIMFWKIKHRKIKNRKSSKDRRIHYEKNLF